MVGADPSQLTRGGLRVALFQRARAGFLFCSSASPPPPPTPDPVSEQAELPADGLMYLDVLRLHRRLCVGEEKRPTKCFCFFTIDIDLLLTAAVSFCVTLTSE